MHLASAGITLPKIALFWAMDAFTMRSCQDLPADMHLAPGCPGSRSAAQGVNACTALGGRCVVQRDGFYPLAYGMALAGLAMGLLFQRMLPGLEALPVEVWRAKSRKLR